ncbi:MAG: helix-turn-helix transcriptional regulator [Clostridiales bacterium]|nr:helix-turn-helix transcriptional regulator [Clostridiales bacterium]
MENKISERIKELLKENNLTPYKLSIDLNVSKSVVHYWISGKTTPNADYIIKLSEYFCVSSDFLLGISDN